MGPFIYVLGTDTRCICSRNKFSVHMRSDYEITELFSVNIAFRFVIGTIHGLRSLTSMHYTVQRENSLVGMIDRLTLDHNARSPQLCTKPRPLEHVLGTTAFRLRSEEY